MSEETTTKTPAQSTPAVDFDALLSAAGDCGTYQLVTFLLIGAMQFVAVDAFAINFIAGGMDHRCLVRNQSGVELQRQVGDDGWSGDAFSRCYVRRHDATHWDSSVTVEPFNSSVLWLNDTAASSVTPCDEWTYDSTLFTSTIVSQVHVLPHVPALPIAFCAAVLA